MGSRGGVTEAPGDCPITPGGGATGVLLAGAPLPLLHATSAPTSTTAAAHLARVTKAFSARCQRSATESGQIVLADPGEVIRLEYTHLGRFGVVVSRLCLGTM